MVSTPVIIGDKASFGLEYSKPSKSSVAAPTFLAVRLWISGVPIGTLDEETYLPSFRHQLRRVTHSEVVFAESKSIVESDESLISLGDTFDDFEMRRFIVGDNVLITAKLVTHPFHSHPQLQKGMTYKGRTPLKQVEAAISEFDQTITF